jgi:hypothetical protein
MESWQILSEAVSRVGVKTVAARLKLSPALVYKWCQPPPSPQHPDRSGARNPLDRLRILLELTRDTRIVNWLCNAAGGFFVPNPHPVDGPPEEELLGATQRVVEDFSEVLRQISRSIENDGRITSDEADLIRQSWERLKSRAEQFVVACERGQYSFAGGRVAGQPPVG